MAEFILPLIGVAQQTVPPRCSGIYIIRNKHTGRFYLGSAYIINRRFNIHRCELRGGRHANSRLQNSWNKHGEDAFEFIVIEEVPRDQLLVREQWFLDNLKPFSRDVGYNLAINAQHAHAGLRHTEETKRRLSESRRGVKRGPQGPLSEEHKQHLSRMIKGRHFQTPESKRKIAEASRRFIRTAEHCRKISESQIGKIIPRWQREMISASLTGKKASPESCIKRSVSLKAAFSTPEQKARRSNAMKRLWADPEFKQKRMELVLLARRQKREQRDVQPR